jgi:ATP-dependent DNA helicase RecG
MDLHELQQLVAAGESETLEFKRTSGERREAAQTLCGMLNHRGGIVLVGVDPKGSIPGQQVSDRTIEEISQEIQQIDPPAFPMMDRIAVDGARFVIRIQTIAGRNSPYTYRNQAYKRVGNTTLRLSRDEYNRMLMDSLHTESRWETQFAENWKVSDLVEGEIHRTMEEAIRRGRIEDPGSTSLETILAGFGLLVDGRLNRAAIVLFGTQEKIERDFPQCCLKLAKFKGTDKSEFLDNRQFYGNAFELLLKAERFLSESLPIAGRVIAGVFERIDEPLYPRVALREGLANAFCHRDYANAGGSISIGIYQDRLEIASTGGLHFGLTADKLFQPHESFPWNPLISRIFYRRGVIESWGRGLLKIAELSAQAGLPRPELDDQTTHVILRFLPSLYIPPRQVTNNLSDPQRAIMQLISDSPGIARRQIVESLGFDLNPVRDDLEKLESLGLIERNGKGRGTVWYLKGAAPAQ